jgi:uncharacterized protein YndB with AHSA1/START domain
MNAVSAVIKLDAPRERVWAVLMDPRRLEDWVTIHHSLGRVSDHPLIVGSTVEQTVRTHGACFDLEWTVTDLDRPHDAFWQARGPARAHATVRYELSSDGRRRTSFRYENSFAMPGGILSAAATRLLGGGVSQREATKSLRRLKHLIEFG